MKQLLKITVFLLALSFLLVIGGCGGSGGGYSSTHYGVYSGYGYGYGYGRDVDVRVNRSTRNERIETRNNVRSSRSGSPASMGRPARMSGGGGGRRR